jgi:hypothetical protein
MYLLLKEQNLPKNYLKYLIYYYKIFFWVKKKDKKGTHL